MIDQTLLILSFIALMLLVGLLSSIISRKLKIPNLLLLILIGIGFGTLTYKGEQVLSFPPIFLTAISIITLAMIVFDSSSRFKLREFDTMSLSALQLSLIFLVLNMVLLSIVTYFFFRPSSFILALIFAAVVSGTDPSSTMMILSGAKSRIFEFLKIESILNTLLIVLIPFLLIDIIITTGMPLLTIISSQAIPFIQQFVAGIGTGLVISLVFFRIMKKYYSETLSPLAIIVVSILAYAGAEVLGGNGVLSVTTAGLMFGNLYRIKHKEKLRKFGEVFSEVFEILVFILIGLVVKIKWTSLRFMIPATILFLLYLLIRFVSVKLSFRKSNYNLKERLYLTLNIPKGIAVAVVIFTLATYETTIPGILPILDLILLFLIYSIILSTIVTHFSKYFTRTSIKVDETQ